MRVKQAGGFGVGLNHLADILVGRVTEKVRDWNHEALTTFGVGRDVARAQWLAIGRELVRLGMLRQTPGLRSVLELTEAGRRTLRERTPVLMTAAAPAAASAAGSPHADVAYDENALRRIARLA